MGTQEHQKNVDWFCDASYDFMGKFRWDSFEQILFNILLFENI